MRKVKAVVALLLAGIMTFTGCGSSNNATDSSTKESSTASESSKSEATDNVDAAVGEKTYNGVDVSEPVTLVMYYVGDTLGDEEMVFGAINEIMEEKINATIEFKSLSLSDYQTNYSLLLAGGDPIDLIYTSGWCYYADEAGKGAFLEITDEMIETYMPETAKIQSKDSIDLGRIDGKLYYVPCEKVGYGHATVLIRGDLREKYGLDPIENLDDLYTYMSAVAADADSGVTYAYNAFIDGKKLESVIADAANDKFGFGGTDGYFVYDYTDNLTADDIEFLYETDDFKEFAYQMKEWSSQGFWSLSSINNQTDVKDSFLNGTSAVYIENLGTCGNLASSVEQSNPEWKPELYDVTMDNVSLASYDNDGYAVPYTAQNPERALMALDILKNDKEAYTIARYGIEDYHITLNDDGTWSKAENYGTWSYGAAISWGLKNTSLEMNQEGTFPAQIELFDEWTQVAKTNPTGGFTFATTNVSDQWANLREVWTTYIPILQLGLIDDVDGWINKFLAEAEACGVDEIKEELARQLNDYLENK